MHRVFPRESSQGGLHKRYSCIGLRKAPWAADFVSNIGIYRASRSPIPYLYRVSQFLCTPLISSSKPPSRLTFVKWLLRWKFSDSYSSHNCFWNKHAYSLWRCSLSLISYAFEKEFLYEVLRELYARFILIICTFNISFLLVIYTWVNLLGDKPVR